MTRCSSGSWSICSASASAARAAAMSRSRSWRLPGEALAHDLDGDQLREALEELALAGLAPALDELHHADLEPVAEAAQATMPQAAVLLPLPVPVWTIRRPFSRVLLP